MSIQSLGTNSSRFNSFRSGLRRWLQIGAQTSLEVDFNMLEIRYTVRRLPKITLNQGKLTKVVETMVIFTETQQLMKVLAVLVSPISKE